MSKFINPATILAQTGLANGQVVADLGCGNGFYVLPAAQLVGSDGMVYAVDVVADKLEATLSIAKQFGVRNVKILRADLTKPLLEVPEGSCDLIILGNILHEISAQEALLKNVYRLLKTGGQVVVVEWKKEASPIGPPMAQRMSPTELEALMSKFALRKTKSLEADGFHYALLFVK